MPKSDDYLLFAVSARSNLSYAKFRELFDQIQLLQQADASINLNWGSQQARALRTLVTLGHCDSEFENGAGRIYSAPSLIARLPFLGAPQAVLCGSRGPQVYELISRAEKEFGESLEVQYAGQPLSGPCVPQRILFSAESEALLANIADRLEIVFRSDPPAWHLASILGSLDRYMGRLSFQNGGELDWPRRDYDPLRLQFSRDFRSASAPHLSAVQNPQSGVQQYSFVKDGQRCFVDRYWGIYMFLSELRKDILLYDQRKMLLAVPVGAPLPLFHARALVLCSGYAPRFIDRSRITIAHPEKRGFDLYTAIPQPLAELVANKVEQQLILTALNIE